MPFVPKKFVPKKFTLLYPKYGKIALLPKLLEFWVYFDIYSSVNFLGTNGIFEKS